MARNSRRAGFSAIELMVVVAIVAILAALLYPAVIDAKARAAQRVATAAKPVVTTLCDEQGFRVVLFEHEGHQYLISTGGYDGGKFMVHSESCPCRTMRAEK